MKSHKFSIKSRIKSFRYALQGIVTLIRNEHNARIHLVVAIAVVIAGVRLHISASEWMAIIFAIGFVFSLEAVNSAIEYIADLVSPDYHPLIQKAKDVAAAAVLIAAISAAAVGLIIFVPKLISLC